MDNTDNEKKFKDHNYGEKNSGFMFEYKYLELILYIMHIINKHVSTSISYSKYSDCILSFHLIILSRHNLSCEQCNTW